MRLQSPQTRPEGEQEPIPPLSRLHHRRLASEVSGELVVQGDDHRLFAWEVSVQQPDADVRLLGDLTQRCRFVAPLADHPNCSLVKPLSRCRALRRLPWRTPTLSELDIFSEHVH